MMIIDYIRDLVNSRRKGVLKMPYSAYYSLGIDERMPFADTLFLNICDLMTDIAPAVQWVNNGGEVYRFAAFKRFFDANGKYALNLIYRRGFVVVGYSNDLSILRILSDNEYSRYNTPRGNYAVEPIDKTLNCYVMQSQTMAMTGKSDYELLRPFLSMIDNVLNGSNTISKRLGAFVIMSPTQPSGAPMPYVLNKQDKEQLEKEIGEGYGYLRNQKGVMLLPNAMNVQTVNLASLDNRMIERLKVAVCAICDRVHVPANQVAIIDANSNKTLANGSELREGDIAKYRAFRRLMNQSWWLLAEALGLRCDYVIENEPTKQEVQNG